MPQLFGTPERPTDDEVDELLEEELDDLELNEEEDDIPDDDNFEELEDTDDAVATNISHTGFVFSVTLSSDGDGLCLSGGEDDVAYLWKRSSGEEVLKIEGHKDSVGFTEFSHDGKLFFTADLAGNVIVHKTHDTSKMWTFDCSDIEWSQWHPSASVLFAGTTDGDVYMWKVPGGECKILQGHGSKTTCATVLPSGKQLFVGYDDASTKLWDLKMSTVLHHLKNGSNGVNDVATNRNGTLLASASINSTVHVVSATSGKICAVFDAGFPQEEDAAAEASVEAVAFSPEQQQLATGSLSGVLAIWDLSNQRLRHRCQHPNGVTKISWLECRPYEIVTACLDGVVRSWDARSGELVNIWKGHIAGILGMDVDRNGQWIATASEDGTCRVFKR